MVFRIAALLLNYRTPDLAIDCLESLVPELTPERDTILVVDNASGDGSAERIREAIDERGWNVARVIESPVNGGFSAGHNIGIRAVEAKAYLLVNSDILARPGAVGRLFTTLEKDGGTGLVSPRLEWPNGEPQISCFRLLTPFSELISAAQTGPVRRVLRRYEVSLPLRDEPFEPEWTSFAAILIRREVFDQIGLLDDGFFMYFEDVDFCRRARRAGWRIRHEPRARFVHLRGGSSPVKSLQASGKRKPRYYYESRRRYFSKAYGRAGLFSANLLWTLGRAIQQLRRRVDRRAAPPVESEIAEIWRS